MSRFFFVLLLLFVVDLSIAQDKKSRWVDSVFTLLGPQEKIGQLTIVTTSSDLPSEDIKLLNDQSKANKIGSIVVLKSSPVRHAKTVNKVQSLSKVPILVTSVLPNGRLAFDSIMHYYDSTVVKAVDNDSLKESLKNHLASDVLLSGIKGEIDLTLKMLGGLKYAEILDIQPKSKKSKTAPSPFIDNDLVLIQKSGIDALIKSTIKSLKKDKALVIKIDSSVKKILRLKFDAGLWKNKYVEADNLIGQFHPVEAQLLKERLASESVTVVKNDSSQLPIKTLDDKTFASISIGSAENEFTRYLSKYAWFRHHFVLTSSDTAGLTENLKGKSVITVGLFKSPEAEITEFIKKLVKDHRVIVCSFTDPKALAPFEQMPTLISAYSFESGIPKAAAEVIFGAIESKGKLPVGISKSLPVGTSIRTSRIDRFSYALPESAGMDGRVLNRIESIANESIAIGATPGINVLIAKEGKVIYEKSFGSLTYDRKSPMTDETIFDLASVTKVSATLQAVMYMQEKGMIDINKKASVYLPELKGTNKEDFTIKDIITHQAGLWPFLPYWAETVKDSSIWKKYYSKTESSDYPFPVSEDLFASKSMKDSLWQWTIKSKVVEKTMRTPYSYRYSDMAFYIMMHIAEKLLKIPLEDFLQKNIYQPIGAYTTGYLPLRKFSPSRIAPTEKDTLFRKSLLIGYVHDQGAAMHGGIAGHAGLFSDANDLAKLGQMWLNKGTYGGIQFFKPETIDVFAAKQYENSRRGLGWDKPVLNEPAPSPTSFFSSPGTFGHTGFTGTCIWVDPEFHLVFVFLSNRVHPIMTNNKILTANIRQRIHDVVYESIFDYCKNHRESLKPNDHKLGLTVKP